MHNWLTFMGFTWILSFLAIFLLAFLSILDWKISRPLSEEDLWSERFNTGQRTCLTCQGPMASLVTPTLVGESSNKTRWVCLSCRQEILQEQMSQDRCQIHLTPSQ